MEGGAVRRRLCGVSRGGWTAKQHVYPSSPPEPCPAQICSAWRRGQVNPPFFPFSPWKAFIMDSSCAKESLKFPYLSLPSIEV